MKNREEGENTSQSFKLTNSISEDFDAPLHRIKVFNILKNILLRMTRSNGLISLGLLNGLLQDIRCELNVEIVRFTSSKKSHSSMGDLIFAEQDHMISATAQMVSTYS